MKLYELLTKIAKGEVKDGTRINQFNFRGKFEYIFEGTLRELNSKCSAEFKTGELNDEVEIIEPDIKVGATTQLIKELDMTKYLSFITRDHVEFNSTEMMYRAIEDTMCMLNKVIAKVNSL